MEMDNKNRTLYIGCEYGLVIKNLDTGEYDLINQWDGVNDLAVQQVIDVELDLANGRVFFALRKSAEVYELDTITKKISNIHKFDDGSVLFKWGDSRSLEYDPVNDILYFARDSGLLVFNVDENYFRFFDFLHFDVDVKSYSVRENRVEVIMFGYWEDRSELPIGQGEPEPDPFGIADIEISPLDYKLFIACHTGLFTYDPIDGTISKRIPSQDIVTPLKDILFVEDIHKLFLAGKKVWSFDPSTNETEVVLEDDLEGERKKDDFLKLLWNTPDHSLIISSGQGPALFFLDWMTGDLTTSSPDRMMVENYPYEYGGWNIAAGNYSEMILDPLTGDLLLSRGTFFSNGHFWNVTYDINSSVPKEKYRDLSSFLEINGYNLIINIDVKGRASGSGTSGVTEPSGSLFIYNISENTIKSDTILDYHSHDDHIYRIHMDETRNHIVSKGNRLFVKFDFKCLWDLDIEDGILKQEYFPYYNETYDEYGYNGVNRIYPVGNNVLVTMARNGSILYDIENGTREFREDIQIHGNGFQMGPVSGHIFTYGNGTGHVLEQDLVTGKSFDHIFNITDPRTGQPGFIEHLVFNSDETLAVIGGIRNLTVYYVENGSLGTKNYLSDIEVHDPNFQFDETFTEIIYHEETDAFYGFTVHGEIIDILNSKRLGYISNSPICGDYCLSPDRSKILTFTGRTITEINMVDGDEPCGLISYDPATGEIVGYGLDVGLPWMTCLGLTVNEENGWICVIGGSYVAVIREEDLDKIKQNNSSTITEDVPVNHPVIEENTETISDELIVGAAGIGLISILGVAMAVFEPLKFKAISVFATPLFSKVRGQDILENQRRRKIYSLIRERPYIHLNGIRRELSLGPGEVVYHLRVLEREGLVRSESRGIRKVFHITGVKIGRDNFLPTTLQRKIIKLISLEPGISQREISRRLNINPSTVNYNLRNLERRRLVDIVRTNSRSRCYQSN